MAGAHAAVKVDPTESWASIQDTSGRLRTWQIAEEGRLGALVMDTREAQCIAMEFEWVGPKLVYWQVSGIEDWRSFERTQSHIGEYVTAHSRTVCWEPERNQQRVLLDQASPIMLSNPEGTKFAVFRRVLEWEAATDLVTLVRVYSFPEMGLLSSFDLVGGELLGGSLFNPGSTYPLWWIPDTDSFFMVASEPGRAYPGARHDTSVRVLQVVSSDGGVHTLTDTWNGRIWAEGRWCVGAATMPVCSVNGGSRAVALVRGWETPHRLSFFSVSGPEREHRFGQQTYYPPGLREFSKSWSLVGITPSGCDLILQDLGPDGCIDYAETGWLYAYNLENGRLRRVVKLGAIERQFGWVGNQWLMVEYVSGVDDEKNPFYRLRHIGAVQVPPENEPEG